MGGKTLASLVGSVDNLHEAVPLANKTETVLGVIISLQILSWGCGLLRLWTRLRVIRSPGWDDLFVFLSMVTTSLGAIAVCISATHYGLGKHFIELGGRRAMSDYLKTFFIANGSYVTATTLIKLALLLQFLRVIDRGTVLRRITYAVLVFVSLWGLAFIILVWFPCSPISQYWSLNPAANCWGFASQDPDDFYTSFKTHTAFNMVLDIIVLCIPVALYFQMDVQSKTRWGILGLLFLGTLSSFASVWRLVTIVNHRAATSPTFDPSWYGCVSILLAAVEVDLAVVCASVPVFWPLLQSGGFQIFVTKEVRITRENRLGSDADTLMERIEGVSMPAGAAGIRDGTNSPETSRSLHKLNSSSQASTFAYADNKDCELGYMDPVHKTGRKPQGNQVSVEAAIVMER